MIKKLTVLFMLFLISCSFSEKKIKLGSVQTGMENLVFNYLLAKYPDKYADIELVYFDTYKQLTRATQKNRLDFSLLPPSKEAFLISEMNYDFLVTTTENGYGLITKDSLNSFEALNNKTIGILSDTHSDFLIDQFAQKNNLKLKTEKLQRVSDISRTLINNEIDAGLVYLPLISKFPKDYHGEFFIHKSIGDYPSSFLMINKKANIPEKLVQGLLADLKESTEIINLNPFPAYSVADELYNLDLEMAREAFYNTRFVYNEFTDSDEFFKKMKTYYKTQQNK